MSLLVMLIDTLPIHRLSKFELFVMSYCLYLICVFTCLTIHSWENMPLPRIHCYGFSTAIDPILDFVTRIAGTLQCSVADLQYVPITSRSAIPVPVEGNAESTEQVKGKVTNNKKVKYQKSSVIDADMSTNPCWGLIVREVAPNKVMVCLTFKLPRSVRFYMFDCLRCMADVCL